MKQGRKPDLLQGSIDEISKFEWCSVGPAKLGIRLVDNRFQLSELLVPKYASIQDKIKIVDGRGVYVIDVQRKLDPVTVIVNGVKEWMEPVCFGRIWIDCKRGLPLRIEHYDKHPNSDEGRLVCRIDSIELHQLSNGGWFPVKGTRTLCFENGKVTSEHITVDVSSITIQSEDIPESLFTLAFPKAAKVYNAFMAKIQMNPREFADAYLAAFKTKDWNLAASMCRPGSKQARNAHMLGQMCDFNDSKIEAVYSNGDIALAITSQLKQVDGRQWQLAFTLTKQEKRWIVKDIDWLPPGKEKPEIEKFLETFPKAKPVPSKKPTVQVEGEEQVLQGRYEVSGTVHDPMPDSWWEDYFAKLEAAESKEEFRRILDHASPSNSERPAAGVVVKLKGHSRGKSITKEVVTDKDGRYSFTSLEVGRYNVSGEQTITSARTGNNRTAFAESRGFEFLESTLHPRNKKIDLNLRDGYVTVVGRVVDGSGKPVAGAYVGGISAPVENDGIGESAEHTAAIRPQRIAGRSDTDGYYELKGFRAAHFSNVFRYLINKKKGIRGPYKFFVDINARAGDFVQSGNKALRVPLAGEEQLYRARRFLEAYSKMFRPAGGEELVENKQPEYPWANSTGGTLTGVDIVLDHKLENASLDVKFTLTVRGEKKRGSQRRRQVVRYKRQTQGRKKCPESL